MAPVLRRLVPVAAGALLLLAVAAPALPPARAAAVSRPGWRLAWQTRFAQPARLGSFGGCSVKPVCTALPRGLRDWWWAYPSPWPDTATQRNERPGGFYCPRRSVWISGGRMHIRMFRAGSGPDCSAAVVPRAALDRKYGRYIEQWRVTRWSRNDPRGRGYKSAHLLWPSGNGGDEVDFPEGQWDENPSAFVHGLAELSFGTGARWDRWHTTEIRWKPGGVTFYLDGRVIGRAPSPHERMDWIIQNESALNGEVAPPRSWAQMDIRYVAYWARAG